MNTTHVAARRICVVLVSLLLLLGAASSVAASGSAEAARTITVVGEGEVSAEPDQATITLGVQLYDESAQAAASELRSRMESVIDAIRALGIPERRIQTTNYSIFFERDYPTASGSHDRRHDRRDRWASYRVENMVRMNNRRTSRAPPRAPSRPPSRPGPISSMESPFRSELSRRNARCSGSRPRHGGRPLPVRASSPRCSRPLARRA